jgi:hypothetical protein
LQSFEVTGSSTDFVRPLLFNEKFVWDKINYIHNNQIEEKFVLNSVELIYSSASNYYFESGILSEVSCLAPRLHTV